MFYIYTQHHFLGTGIRDKDFLLLMDTLHTNKIEYDFLPKDFSNVEFTDDDFIYLNIGSVYLDEFLEQKHILDNKNVFPNIQGMIDTYNKDVCNEHCKQNNIPIPKTFKSIQDISQSDFPLIFKPVSGSLGEHIALCNSVEDINNQINLLLEDEHYFNKNYILQEFINTGNMPIKYRVIFIGREILVSYKAESKYDEVVCTLGDDQWPNITINPNNENVLQLAQKFIDTVGKNCNFGALDIIQDLKGNCYLLELNGPTKLYRASQGIGINLYESIINYILTKNTNKL
tara:strand:+ start:258 stop:1118 length:861 start_codon:yes stop_codon:yes gene_type:complete